MATVTKEQLSQALQDLAMRRDDPRAWEIVITGSWATALAVAHRVLRGQLEPAQDVAQEVFRRIVQYCNFQELQDGDAFLAYVRAVSLNAARDALRRLVPRAAEVPLEELETGRTPRSGPETPDEILLAQQLREELLAQLDPTDQQLLQLLIEGYSLGEIATRLRLSYSNAGVRLYRLREFLRNYITEKGL
jgi:RNA polymerase sigma factor (sigma-70 family)